MSSCRRNNSVLVSLVVVLVVLCKEGSFADDGGFRPILPSVWKAPVGGSSSDESSHVSGSGFPSSRSSYSKANVKDVEDQFVPKSIPIRRSDAVPALKRELLYGRMQSYPDVVVDNNSTGNHWRNVQRTKKIVKVSEEASTEAWLSNISKALVVLENAITGEDDLHEVEGRSKIGRKYRKYLLPLLLAYKLKFFALIPLMMGGLVLLAGSTGFAGFFFALFAATMGLKTGGHN